MKQITVYTFEELKPEVQAKIIARNESINTQEDWWMTVFEDAKMVGIELTEFRLGHLIKGNIYSHHAVARAIIDEHGSETATYKLAKQYDIDLGWKGESSQNIERLFKEAVEQRSLRLFKEAVKASREHEEKYNDLDENFKKAILYEYQLLLAEELNYLMSEEAIRETIIANENLYTEDGILI